MRVSFGTMRSPKLTVCFFSFSLEFFITGEFYSRRRSCLKLTRNKKGCKIIEKNKLSPINFVCLSPPFLCLGSVFSLFGTECSKYRTTNRRSRKVFWLMVQKKMCRKTNSRITGTENRQPFVSKQTPHSHNVMKIE